MQLGWAVSARRPVFASSRNAVAAAHLAVVEEGAEKARLDGVPEPHEVLLVELERGRVLVLQLEDAVQELQKDRAPLVWPARVADAVVELVTERQPLLCHSRGGPTGTAHRVSTPPAAIATAPSCHTFSMSTWKPLIVR